MIVKKTLRWLADLAWAVWLATPWMLSRRVHELEAAVFMLQHPGLRKL